jgi:hypothetical protein
MLMKNNLMRVFIVIGVTGLLSGCSSLVESYTVSDVTDEQLKYLLLEAESLPGFTAMNGEDLELAFSEWEEGIKDIEDELCDKNRVFQGAILVNEDESIFVNTTSEPVCVSVKDYIEFHSSEEGIEEFNNSFQATLTNLVAQVGGGVKNVKTRLISNDGFGGNIIIYETTADMIYEDEVGYISQTYIIMSEKAALYIVIESYVGYDGDVEKLATKLVTNGQYKLDYIK